MLIVYYKVLKIAITTTYYQNEKEKKHILIFFLMLLQSLPLDSPSKLCPITATNHLTPCCQINVFDTHSMHGSIRLPFVQIDILIEKSLNSAII